MPTLRTQPLATPATVAIIALAIAGGLDFLLSAASLESVPAWLHWWWAMWLTSAILGTLSGVVLVDAATANAYRTSALVAATGSAAGVAAAALALQLVRELTARQGRACALAQEALRRQFARAPF